MRAAVQKETKRGGREQLVVTALPYAVSKSKVIEQIAQVARTKLDEISDLRDESDRDGMRIVIELKRGAQTQPILNTLYKQTYLQATFGAIMLALDRRAAGAHAEADAGAVPRSSAGGDPPALAVRPGEGAGGGAHHRGSAGRAGVHRRGHRHHPRVGGPGRGGARAVQLLRADGAQARAILAMRLGRLTALETADLKKQLRS
jgi:DNA gyrase/topoisomerase IV subunit A